MGLVLVRLTVIEKAGGPIKFLFCFPNIELSVEGNCLDKDSCPCIMCRNVTVFH